MYIAIISLSITQSHLSVFNSNVLGLAFLLVFSTLLLVQFVAMAYHRVSTAIHIIATATNTSTTDSRYTVCALKAFGVGVVFSCELSKHHILALHRMRLSYWCWSCG